MLGDSPVSQVGIWLPSVQAAPDRVSGGAVSGKRRRMLGKRLRHFNVQGNPALWDISRAG